MARKIILIATVAATLVAVAAPVSAIAQDRYGDGNLIYSRQYEHGDRDRNSYENGDRRQAWIAHERHERWEQEQASRRYWQHERWERQNEHRRDWSRGRSDHGEQYHRDDGD